MCTVIQDVNIETQYYVVVFYNSVELWYVFLLLSCCVIELT